MSERGRQRSNAAPTRVVIPRPWRRTDVMTRIERKTNKNGPNGCWLWTGSLSHNGYGQITARNAEGACISQRVHRIVLARATGVDRPDMFALHSCDTPSCVNPDHLRWGRQSENVDDMWRRGRADYKHLCEYIGTRNHNAKLNEEKVREIRARYASGGVYMRELAAEFGVHSMTINCVVRRVTWRHV